MERSLKDQRLISATDLLRTVFADPVELAVHLAPIILLKYLNILSDAESRCVTLPNINPNKVNLRFPEGADIFAWELNSFNDLGVALNLSLKELESANPREMRNLFIGIDYCDPRFGKSDYRKELLSSLLSLIDKLDSLLLQDAALYRLGLTDLLFESVPFTSRTFIEFATPYDVAELMSGLVAPKNNEKIYDPACGSGQILISCLRSAVEHGVKNISAAGAERNYLTWVLARLNFIFSGYPAEDLELKDSISSSADETKDEFEYFDIAISNPPKGQRDWGYNPKVAAFFENQGFTVPPKSNGDFAFVLHMLSRLRPNSGRMAVILPDGALFRKGAEEYIRKSLVKKSFVKAVIALPLRLLYNTALGTTILILDTAKDPGNKVLFINARGHGHSEKSRNVLPREAIKKIRDVVSERAEIPAFSRMVTAEEIGENDYILSAPRYVTAEITTERFDLAEISNHRSERQKDLEAIETELDKIIASVIKDEF